MKTQIRISTADKPETKTRAVQFKDLENGSLFQFWNNDKDCWDYDVYLMVDNTITSRGQCLCLTDKISPGRETQFKNYTITKFRIFTTLDLGGVVSEITEN